MNVLIVVAHPDDEALGAGGLIHRLSKRGCKVDCCIMSGDVEARSARPETRDLHEDIISAKNRLGYRNLCLGQFKNIEFNNVPHIELVRYIETRIEEFDSQVIFTHHPSDLNNDHTQTAQACLAASRLWQRRPSISRLEQLYFIEVPSSTDWSFPGHNSMFQANTYLALEEDDLEAKISAVDAYRNVMRPPPHSRSRENITALARYRGAQSGYIYAEAFQRVFGSLLL